MARAAYANHADVLHAMSSDGAPRGNAVDAVVAGLFCYAALEPSLLLGPLQLLIGGPGAGLHALDGRVRQPGKGAERPRGVREGEEVPAAAMVGVPCFVPTALVALNQFGSCTLRQTLGASVELARPLSKPRAAVLRLVMEQGTQAQRAAEFGGVLLTHFGRMQGGLLTEEDLQPSAPPMLSPALQPLRVPGYQAALLPEAIAADELVPPGRFALVMATDARGLFCAAVAQVSEGAPVAELGLLAPLCATPVRRGVERPKVGSAVAAPAPMALIGRDGLWEMALLGGDRLSLALQAWEAAWGAGEPAPLQEPAQLLLRGGSQRVLRGA